MKTLALSDSRVSRSQRVIALVMATAVAAVVSIAAASPASAAGTSGYRSCGSLVRVHSNTTGAAAWLLVSHTTNVIDAEWAYSGYHYSNSSQYATNWSVYTTHTLVNGYSSCSGIA